MDRSKSSSSPSHVQFLFKHLRRNLSSPGGEVRNRTAETRSGAEPFTTSLHPQVGLDGFEPPLTWSQTRDHNQTRPQPLGLTGGTRTLNLSVYSQALHLELRSEIRH